MSSPGSASRSARTTVSPPTPESNTPIGRRDPVTVVLTSKKLSWLRVDSSYGSASGVRKPGALRQLMLPRATARSATATGPRPRLGLHRAQHLGLVRPHELQESRGLHAQAVIEPTDPWEALLRLGEVPLGDPAGH